MIWSIALNKVLNFLVNNEVINLNKLNEGLGYSPA